MNRKEIFLKTRRRMFIFGLIGLFVLAAWTLSAFWEHIDQLGGNYSLGAKLVDCSANFCTN
jgi:hypothetical protein